MGTSLDSWIDGSATLLERLEADQPALEEAFGEEAGLGSVVDIETDLSDPHRAGRSVAVLTFASGLRVVYKPKEVGLEAAYFALLDCLNRWGAPLGLKTLRVVERPEYGWVEHAQYLPCRTA